MKKSRKTARPEVALPPMPNARFLTGGLGQALALQNTRTHEALIATGHDKIDFKSGAKLPGDYPFSHDLGFTKLAASIGRTIARDLVGVNIAEPLIWPDMEKVEAAARVPMSEETKAALRARSIAQPRNIGDEVARQLEGKSLPEVYEAAAKYLGEDLKVLIAKYKHLNPGQQRMVCGNRMRAKWKAENLYAKTRGAYAEEKGSAASLSKVDAGKAPAAGPEQRAARPGGGPARKKAALQGSRADRRKPKRR